jgi:hypothetical protein
MKLRINLRAIIRWGSDYSRLAADRWKLLMLNSISSVTGALHRSSDQDLCNFESYGHDHVESAAWGLLQLLMALSSCGLRLV